MLEEEVRNVLGVVAAEAAAATMDVVMRGAASVSFGSPPTMRRRGKEAMGSGRHPPV